MKEFKGTPGPWEANERIGISAAITHRNPAAIGVPGPTLARVIIRYSALEQGQANLKVIAAAPDLLQTLLMGQTMQTPEFLHWIADRLVYVHGEHKNADFVVSLRKRAEAMTAAINKALGQ